MGRRRKSNGKKAYREDIINVKTKSLGRQKDGCRMTQGFVICNGTFEKHFLLSRLQFKSYYVLQSPLYIFPRLMHSYIISQRNNGSHFYASKIMIQEIFTLVYVNFFYVYAFLLLYSCFIIFKCSKLSSNFVTLF